MCLAVGEQEVDEHAHNGEEEDDQAPQELVDGRAVRFEDLDEDKYVQDQDNQSDDTAARAIPDGIALGVELGVAGQRCRESAGSEEELEEERLNHVDG